MNRRAVSGFSLLELAVALAITSLCLALVATSLHGVFRANENAREHLELQQTTNETLARLRTYIQAAYLSPFLANEVTTTFETMDDSSLREPYDALTFTTLAHSSHQINAKESDLIEITLFTEKEKPIMTRDGEVRLRRLRVRAGGEINDNFEVEGGTVYTLADHVTRLEFEYLSLDGEWKPEWFPYDNSYNLPCMVRVVLGLRTEDLEERRAEITVPLEMCKLRCRFEDERVFEEK
jgi:prepilin-type N-terminal cleavage/methylation domain-containing protein